MTKRFGQPPSGGCVLKRKAIDVAMAHIETSRLQAAVC